MILSSTVHEYFHAWSAQKLGDDTAAAEGRLSLNPLLHIDLIGLISMFIVRVGWSKPVPVNTYNFRKPARDHALVSLAGPLSNFVIFLVATLLLKGLYSIASAGFVGTVAINLLYSVLFVIIYINLSLALFNLLPIPPLDGFHIVSGLLPKNLRYYWDMLDQYGLYIFIGLFYILNRSGLFGIFFSGYLKEVLRYIFKIVGIPFG